MARGIFKFDVKRAAAQYAYKRTNRQHPANGRVAIIGQEFNACAYLTTMKINHFAGMVALTVFLAGCSASASGTKFKDSSFVTQRVADDKGRVIFTARRIRTSVGSLWA